jgi:uncharacterized alkaline shock family protein YloU
MVMTTTNARTAERGTTDRSTTDRSTTDRGTTERAGGVRGGERPTAGMPGRTAALEPTGGPPDLVTSQGRTSIADSVVRKIAGVATRDISGVHGLGTGTARAFGSVRRHIPGSSGASVGQGVSVEVGERQAAIDLDVVCEYGVSIVDLSHAIRRNVISSVEGLTGLEVTEVNISIDDVYIAEDNGDQSGRVQ